MGNKQDSCSFICQFPEMSENPLCGPGIQPRCRFICDNETGLLCRSRGDHDPSGHSAGKLKRISVFCLRFHSVTFQRTPVPLFCFPVFFPFPQLGAYFHKRIQIGYPLRHQHDLPSPELFCPLRSQEIPVIPDHALPAAVIGQNIQNTVSQKTLPGTAGACHRHNLSRINFQTQIPDNRQTALMHARTDTDLARSAFVLYKFYGQMFNLQNWFQMYPLLFVYTGGVKQTPDGLPGHGK